MENNLGDIVEGVEQNKRGQTDPGFPNIATIEPEYIIKNIAVRNSGCQQGELVKNREFDSKADLVSMLKDNMTEIHLDLHDLTNKQVVCRSYEVIKK